MMRRPEFLMMRRPCAAMRRHAPPPQKRGLDGLYITTVSCIFIYPSYKRKHGADTVYEAIKCMICFIFYVTI
jgi:hypothetical protein